MPLILAGRYIPQRTLGRGGFGATFWARDRYTPTQRPCVVKLFQPATSMTPQTLQVAQTLFEREAMVLEELGNQHPQIPDLYAFFPLQVAGGPGTRTEEYFYLVQEFIDGQDLGQILAQQGPRPEAEVQAMLTSMLKVLAFVHRHGTIHRDIKPSNIMRRRDGRLFLLDFGAVKQATAAAPQSTSIYSTGYAPPEQMAGGTVYPATDLYALAVTCLELLTAQEPKQLYDPYQNRWQWPPQLQVTPSLKIVLQQMLMADPQQRYASAEDALVALQPPKLSTTLQPSTTKSAPAQAPSPSGKTAPPTPPPPSRRRSTSSFSLVEFLGGAAFTGFEGSLLALALASTLGTTWLGSGAWLLLLAGLVALQWRRVIERVDLIIIAAVTLGVVLWFPPLRLVLAGLSAPGQAVVALAIMAALGTVAIATLYRLIYHLISHLL
nr:serine/threonine-protein kinase [Halomicronema hongdechloris]